MQNWQLLYKGRQGCPQDPACRAPLFSLTREKLTRTQQACRPHQSTHRRIALILAQPTHTTHTTYACSNILSQAKLAAPCKELPMCILCFLTACMQPGMTLGRAPGIAEEEGNRGRAPPPSPIHNQDMRPAPTRCDCGPLQQRAPIYQDGSVCLCLALSRRPREPFRQGCPIRAAPGGINATSHVSDTKLQPSLCVTSPYPLLLSMCCSLHTPACHKHACLSRAMQLPHSFP